MPGGFFPLCMIIFLLICIYLLTIMWLMSVDFEPILEQFQNNDYQATITMLVIGLSFMIFGRWRYQARYPDDDGMPAYYEDMDGSVILDFDRLATVMTCQQIARKSRRPKFDWRNVTVICEPPIYKGGADGLNRSSRVLYTKTYSNSGKTAAVHPVQLCISTVSTVEVFILKTFVINKVMRIQFNSMKSASGADLNPEIAQKLNQQKGLVRTANLSQNLDVNTEVSVPPNTKVTLQLEVHEETYEGRFELLSTIEGTVTVKVRTGQAEAAPHNLLQDFATVLTDEGLSKDQDGKLTYLSKGIFKYKLVLGHTINKIKKPLGTKQERNPKSWSP